MPHSPLNAYFNLTAETQHITPFVRQRWQALHSQLSQQQETDLRQLQQQPTVQQLLHHVASAHPDDLLNIQYEDLLNAAVRIGFLCWNISSSRSKWCNTLILNVGSPV